MYIIRLFTIVYFAYKHLFHYFLLLNSLWPEGIFSIYEYYTIIIIAANVPCYCCSYKFSFFLFKKEGEEVSCGQKYFLICITSSSDMVYNITSNSYYEII